MKIRFVKSDKKYFIQRRFWYGWMYLRYEVCNWAGCYYQLYCNEDKRKLLSEYLDRKKLCERHVEIIEYPELKILK